MPNNKQVAQQRAQYLLKRFQKDQLFFEEYNEFMHNVSMEGHSEIIPQEQLKHEEGKVWYIPHHGIYHPRKKTLRVVYDCAPTFAGTSLNKELLQGPDLTSTLLGVLIRFRQGPIALMTDIKGMFHQIPEENRATGVKMLDLSRDQLPTERALGVQLDIEHDVFTFSIVNKNKPLTRCGILSNVSSIYDPLGFLAPVILPAKQILQHLCKLRFGWDETIPAEMAQTWQKWVEDLVLLNKFSISRCVTPKGFGEIKSAQLHHFCDASETGYGAVSYLRLSNSKQEVCVSFIIGKARVAPLKQVTIPRLELAAAVLAVRLDKMLSVELNLNLSESVFWSDSTTVLQYIANTTTRFKTYVANRVSIIHALTKVEQWRYISSKLNPADAASRGMTVCCFLKSSTWISGPEFLSKPVVHWPVGKNYVSVHLEADPEIKGEGLMCAAVLKEDVCPTTKLLLYFSSWTKLKRRFICRRGQVKEIRSDNGTNFVSSNPAPRNSWPIGRITETMADAHGVVRRVRVKTRTNELERPINKICLLVEAI
ncbi:uncharacterized protein LOC120433807 [Oreochromis aureus]|uniref:uncharacterized protein LOC120433807 n=1 Tax=Oreochromis aureus TaxID=47969 RepID=UPI001954F3D2|nr:uncharacterized protein LOC120433807 [Oreochromis aureus]